METKNFFLSHDVKFSETIFPFSNIQTPSNQEPILPNFSFHITNDIPLKQFSTTNIPSPETQKSEAPEFHEPEQTTHASNPPEPFLTNSSQTHSTFILN